ncbi:MAG: hypothetical protein CM15mP121_0140 [Bacteroidota bacterium]|nr:MAG: hypothetical protein CM15mP121_0140 [Bacteroidota bacterium]
MVLQFPLDTYLNLYKLWQIYNLLIDFDICFSIFASYLWKNSNSFRRFFIYLENPILQAFVLVYLLGFLLRWELHWYFSLSLPIESFLMQPLDSRRGYDCSKLLVSVISGHIRCRKTT